MAKEPFLLGDSRSYGGHIGLPELWYVLLSIASVLELQVGSASFCAHVLMYLFVLGGGSKAHSKLGQRQAEHIDSGEDRLDQFHSELITT